MSDVPLTGAEITGYLDGRLEVRGAPLVQVFLMKLHANRPHDIDDLAHLWSHTGFGSVEEAAAYALAYPHEAEDPHLGEFIAGVVARA